MMDVDNDLDGQLLQKFSSMGTTDKEVLILEFQKLLGNQLNPEGCAFFLDMNNWNLQAAIGSYYDYEQPITKPLLMSFVKDVTIGEGESIPPNTHFVKTWRVQNSGDEAWPPGCNLRYTGGQQFGHRECVMVESLQPGAMTDISVEMVSTGTHGIYQGQWRMASPTGMYFGDTIWVIIQVEESGLMGVTQQLSQFGSDFTTHSPQHPTVNPFASPIKPDGTSPRPAFGSPSPSVIAHHGSAPGSPFTLDSSSSLNSTLSPSNVRTALFQNTGDSHNQDSTGLGNSLSQEMDSSEAS